MNPWNIQSIYDLQYYNCPECIYKINSKQEFINHAYSFHPESEDYLRNIKDGSISDIDLPIDSKFELKTDLDLSSYQSNNLDIKIDEFKDTKDDNYTCRFAGSFLCRRQSANWPAFAAGKSAKPAKVKDGKNPIF